MASRKWEYIITLTPLDGTANPLQDYPEQFLASNTDTLSPLTPDVKMHILLTVLHTFLVEQERRIGLNIKTSYPWWSLSLFSSLECLNKNWLFIKEKFHFCHLNLVMQSIPPPWTSQSQNMLTNHRPFTDFSKMKFGLVVTKLNSSMSYHSVVFSCSFFPSPEFILLNQGNNSQTSVRF